MEPNHERARVSRRQFLTTAAGGVAGLALTANDAASASVPGIRGKAQRCIFVFLEGGVSQIDLYDPKPRLNALHGQPAPAFMDAHQTYGKAPVLVGSPYAFARHGRCGMEWSELLPCLSTCVDDIALIRSLQTEVCNHHPGRLIMHTGATVAGQPTLGAWLAYGFGNDSGEAPGYAVLTSGQGAAGGSTNWSGGFLPSHCAGVLQPATRNLAGEDERTLETFGVYRDERGMRNADGGGQGDFAAFARNCLQARRLVERGARFVGLYHGSWDHHANLPRGLAFNCAMADQPLAALLRDLKDCGLLDSTLVVCASEFGRSPWGYAGATGREHHTRAFSIWMAGGGIRGGQVVGATDELGWDVVEEPVHVRDLHATVLRLFGIEPSHLTHPAEERLCGLPNTAGRIVPALLA